MGEARDAEEPGEMEVGPWGETPAPAEDRSAILDDLRAEVLQREIRELEREADELERERARRHPRLRT